MYGEGTSYTATGLKFTCAFKVYEPVNNEELCECKYTIDIPYSSDNTDTFHCPCLEINGYTPVPIHGNEFRRESVLDLVPYPHNITYCPASTTPFNSTTCFDEHFAHANKKYVARVDDNPCPAQYPWLGPNGTNCYETCPEQQVNFRDVCLEKSKLVQKLVAPNACRVDTYEFEERSDASCNNDCDCRGNRFCQSKKCYDL